MEDFITVLLDHLSEHWTPSSASGEYVRRLQQEEAAFEALQRTFSPEQYRLFLAYEEAHNAYAGISEDAYARAAFLMAKEIYR